MRLSARSGWPSEPSPWAEAVARAKAHAKAHARARAEDGNDLVDLTLTNPTAVGLVHDAALYRALGTEAAARYHPRARGSAEARAAVAGYYARRGIAVDPERVLLYASTSEAYAQLLAIVADPGDAVLVPRPGYPLLDMLGDVVGVRRVPYPLAFDGAWYLDRTGLDAALSAEPRARAIVVVAPSNPTGHVPTADEQAALRARAVAHDLPLLIDEVFADYPLRGDVSTRCFAAHHDVPCVVLSGLSKVAALPQLKLSWAVLHGPSAEVDELRARAELAADAFLSVSTPVQLALPRLLEAAEELQPRIHARLRANIARIATLVRDQPVDLLPADAGWTALLRLPSVDGLDDLGWALRLLDAGVLVQPGFLFDLGAPPRVAMSLLTPPEVLDEGMTRLLRGVAAAIDR
ncbi:pyridoxal phosphate-dependent aminotransferase [Paraliomyxa miuraensis]|uniref:pyridoxal phosphate-dependent aminotransferase n=1 Tax=Paraliomyxa miuraensis TaxID=376150 RepID=UPI00225A212A|nr:pyridoxal phosphate-dependent aminotransferase [Paraliomyxa miuraensis]MCX4243259.1 pyridoxal phosphate-dependent aminotransferase [Paraliomyxa miuraensis]